MTDPLFVSAGLLGAVTASGLTRQDVVAAVRATTGCGATTVHDVLAGRRVPHNNGRNTIVAAVCGVVGFPEAEALSPEPSPRAPRRAVIPPPPAVKAHPPGISPAAATQTPEQPDDISPQEIERRYQRALADIRAKRAPTLKHA